MSFAPVATVVPVEPETVVEVPATVVAVFIGAVVFAVVDVVAVVFEVAVVVEVVATTSGAKTGAAFQLLIVKVEQSVANKFLIRPYSLWSIERAHRALIEIQSPRYVHQ